MLFSNKTSAWLSSKTLQEREEFLKKGFCITPEFKQLYHSRRKKLLEARATFLQAKGYSKKNCKERSKRKGRISSRNHEVNMAYGNQSTKF